jgi:tetratricopeptide (TPR) repeat protein
MADLVPAAEERRYIGLRLGRLLGVVDTATDKAVLSREELFAGWRMFLEQLSVESPVVLLVEDGQHADPALLDFLDHVVDWAKTAPIYMLVLTRSEQDTRSRASSNGAGRLEVALGRLDADEMNGLVAALLPGIDTGSVEAVAQQARGNPLFCVEIVRSLVEGGVVTADAGTYRLTGDVAALAVPDTLQALLAARLDSLPPTARALVGDAAVLGTTFSAEALAAVSGRSLQSVQRDLAGLASRAVFEVSTDPLSPQQGSYEFGQHMLRQVALETLSRRDRKARHLAVARHLRSSFANDAEEVMGVVAQHYVDALSAVPEDPDAHEISGEATEALLRAARVADRSGASARAGRLFCDAASLMVQETPSRTLEAAAAWEEAARAYERAGSTARAEELANNATAVYDAQGQPRAAARSRARSGRLAGLQGRHQQAHSALTAAVEVLTMDSDDDTVFALGELAALEIFASMPGWRDRIEAAVRMGLEREVAADQQARLFILLGIGFSRANMTTEAFAAYDRASELAERTGDSRMLALCLTNRARLVPPALAVDADRRACELARRVGASALWPGCVNNLVWTLMFLGEWDEAQVSLLSAASEPGSETYEPMLATLALLAALRGDTDDSRAHSDLPGLRGSEDPQDRLTALVTDAFLAESLGHAVESQQIATRILEHFGTTGLTHDLLYWTWSLAARLAAGAGDLDRLRDLIAMVERHPADQLPALLVAEHALARARLLAAQSDERAEDAWVRAVEQLREVGSPYHLAHAVRDRAEHLRRAGEAEAALALAAEARTIAIRLGARPLLERCAGLVP